MRTLCPFLSIFLLFATFSCEKTTVNSQKPTENQAKLELYVTDAPGSYKEIALNIQQVKVRIDTSNSQNAKAGIWQEVPVKKAHFNLLNLRNGRDTLVASGEVYSGTLKEIKFSLGDNNSILLEDGQSFDLLTPDSIHSQAKMLLLPYARTTAPEQLNQIVVDFDVLKSVVPDFDAQDSSKTIYRFTPYTRTFSKKAGGAIEGWVLPMEAQPTIKAISSEKDTITTKPDNGGYFKLWGLPTGTYTLQYIPSSIGYNRISENGIQITAGKLITSDTVRLVD